MQPPKSSICVICGIRSATTAEHVPPRGFFKDTVGQFRTVPACDICNNGSSEDDESLRNFISAQIGKQTPGAKNLWEMGAHKSLLRSTKIRSALLSTLQEVAVTNEDGSSTTRLRFSVPVSLYQRVFERVTRGLNFLHTGKILPIDILVRINLLTHAPDVSSSEFRIFEKHSIAEGAFEYRFVLDPEEPSNGVWLFTIHGSHWVQSSTGVLVDNAP
jgi:hypothetical protein